MVSLLETVTPIRTKHIKIREASQEQAELS